MPILYTSPLYSRSHPRMHRHSRTYTAGRLCLVTRRRHGRTRSALVYAAPRRNYRLYRKEPVVSARIPSTGFYSWIDPPRKNLLTALSVPSRRACHAATARVGDEAVSHGRHLTRSQNRDSDQGPDQKLASGFGAGFSRCEIIVDGSLADLQPSFVAGEAFHPCSEVKPHAGLTHSSGLFRLVFYSNH